MSTITEMCTTGSTSAFHRRGCAQNDQLCHLARCLVMDVLEHPQQGETKFFLTTYMRIDKLYFVDVPKSQDSCPDAAGVDEIRDDAKKIGVNIVGVCLFNTVDQYFAIHPEDIPFVSKRAGYGLWRLEV